MQVIESVSKRRGAPATALLRASCVALFVCLTGCGGGSGGSAADASPDPGTTPAPASLVIGTPLSIDGGASGNPVDLRVMRSANGDGFAVWQANRPEDDAFPSLLWASRYRAATGTWSSPVNIATGSMGRGEAVVLPSGGRAFDLTVDANGNAVVAWVKYAGEPDRLGVVMSARFDASTGAWSPPVLLNDNGTAPRLASDATGAVLVVYMAAPAPSSPPDLNSRIKGRFLDPASGAWQAETLIEQNHLADTSSTFTPQAALDGSGNALVAFGTGIQPSRFVDQTLASNYYSRTAGTWGGLPAEDPGLFGVVPGTGRGVVLYLQVVATTDGNFLAAWQENLESGGREVAVARFASRTRKWTAKQTLIPADLGVWLQRIGSDASGNVHLMWTHWNGTRQVLKATRLGPDDDSCGAVQTIDQAVGGWAAHGAGLAVDARGDAIAIWDRVDPDGLPDSPRNIAINHFDRAAGAWGRAVLVEGQTTSRAVHLPSASVSGGQALLGWLQPEGDVNRVKVLLQPLASPPGQ